MKSNHRTPPSFPFCLIAVLFLLGQSAQAIQVNIVNYGATSGGGDDTTAIRNAITAAGPGGTVYVPPGTFHHNGELIFGDRSLLGAGDTSILEATNPDFSWKKFTGSGVSVKHILVRIPGATTRNSNDER